MSKWGFTVIYFFTHGVLGVGVEALGQFDLVKSDVVTQSTAETTINRTTFVMFTLKKHFIQMTEKILSSSPLPLPSYNRVATPDRKKK